MSQIKSRVKEVFPDRVWTALRRGRQKLGSAKRRVEKGLWERYLIKTASLRHRIALRKVKKKDTVRVALFLARVEIWKCDSLYWALEKSERFEPVVVVIPFTIKGERYKKKELLKAKKYCINKGFQFVNERDSESYHSKEIKESVEADIIIFTNPKQFEISDHVNDLTCYIPYSFRISSEVYEYEYNSLFVNLTWKNFFESEVHRAIAEKYARNDGVNVEALGFPHFDKFRKESGSDPWVQSATDKKRIIWAPHWTIEGYQGAGINWSCFLEYQELFIELADKYKEDVQFALKPHPSLVPLLQRENLWGKAKTDEYIQTWKETPNLQYVDSEYVDLFLNSDALIHDSGSFMVEYLMTENPVAYTFQNRNPKDDLNAFGEKAFDVHTHVQSEDQLERFVVDVIEGRDKKGNVRADFAKHHLDLHGRNVGEKIVDYLSSQV